MTNGRQAYAEELIQVFRKVVGVVLMSWHQILRVGLITAALALIVTEIVACLVNSSLPPPPTTHLVAVALALALGYSAAVTTLFALLLKGGVRFIQHLEGDVAVGAHAASIFARREVGDVGAGLRRVLGTRSNSAKESNTSGKLLRKPRPVISTRGTAAAAAVTAIGLDVARAGIPRARPSPPLASAEPYGMRPEARRDPDDAIITAPAPAFQPLPVLATRLPRIEWTYDEKQPQRVSPPSLAPTASLAVQPILPEPSPVLEDQATISVPVSEVAEPQAVESAFDTPPPAAASALESLESPMSSEKPETFDTSHGTPDVPGVIPRGWRRTGSITRPLPAVTRPLPVAGDARAPGGGRSGGLWERVSQALVGQPGLSEIENGERNDQPLFMSDVPPEDTWLNE